MNIKLKVGFRIKELRKQKNLSQEKLALKAEIDRTHMHSIEAGKTNVSIEILEKIANALEINIIELFKND
ncbi:helix-turn-helix domain-containing protein [Flavobacterium yafengii]|uniref:helix-turn-helix domain-containing protein n=1 Tax=Flavobacterium yafengii TaxID=3041253 RepID=UPI0024A8A4ED|nr:helix-turn-helix transcriptional regulator [Flavobacterium yafengii]MDI6047045.1 helix-turn-helix transcriptional regulator [Flavobacterium yafengii]